MKILALDGGGIRGYYAAHILRRIKESFKTNFSNHFDLIAGTSTGSIIAAALAVDIPIERICRLYENHGKEIFKSCRGSFGGAIRPMYNHNTLKRLLDKEFGNRTLNDTATKLIIPATNIRKGQVHVFKSNYDEEFTRDLNIKIADAVLASCSAPAYFKPAYIDSHLLADGGLWANNPSLVAITEAITRLKTRRESIQLLSIGAGIGKNYYAEATVDDMWGFLTGWRRQRFIEMLINIQSINAYNSVGLLLPDENLIRINFKTNRALPLDDVRGIPKLQLRANRSFKEYESKLEIFLDD